MIMQECVMMLSSDIPRILELENNLDLYISKEKKNFDISDDKMLSYIQKTIEYFKMMEDNKINPQFQVLFPTMVAQFLYKEFKVPFTPINKEILKKLEEMKESDEKNEKLVNLYLKFFFYINLA